MSARSRDPLHPDDIPPVIELREDLSDAFQAALKRYKDAGLRDDEARDEAATFVRATLKHVALDFEPELERASARVLWNYLMRQRAGLLWILLCVALGLLGGAFWLGTVVGSNAK